MHDFNKEPLVSPDWLAGRIGDANVKIVDSSFYLPAEMRDAKAEFTAAHIPGAVFFDIDEIADKSIKLPHMFPPADTFNTAVGAMGIANDDIVITYDGGKMTGACRAWWMFRAFGHQQVGVLDGGMSRWKNEGHLVESGMPTPVPATYSGRLAPGMVKKLDDVLAIIKRGDQQILDARSTGRFDGTAPEPRPGLRQGHMPGALNLPYDTLLTPLGTLRPVDELNAAFAAAGVDLDRPVVTSCGSGVSAAVLLMGLHLLGHADNALYDGSWAEWGSRADTPIEQ